MRFVPPNELLDADTNVARDSSREVGDFFLPVDFMLLPSLIISDSSSDVTLTLHSPMPLPLPVPQW